MIALAKPDNRILLDTVICGDALACLRGMPDNSVDAIVTDPPAGVGFMGKDWDTFKPEYIKKGLEDLARTFKPKDNPRYGKSNYAGPAMLAGKYDYSRESKKAFIKFMTDIMTEALRVLKPGGHALVWALPRTSHWTALALEDAGFEIRDCVYHIFGSGFPKSTAIDKQIDKMKGAEREVVGRKSFVYPDSDRWGGEYHSEQTLNSMSRMALPGTTSGDTERYTAITAPATPEAQQWQGWGSALKPAVECWWLCRKPLAEPSIAANVLKWGVGGLNVDACRVGLNGMENHRTAGSGTLGGHGIYGTANEALNSKQVARAEQGLNPRYDPQGRFPSHLLLSHSLWCVPTGTKRVRASRDSQHNISMFAQSSKQYETRGYADQDGYEQVDAYDCHESCPIRALDEQSGVRNARGGNREAVGNGYSSLYGNSAVPENVQTHWYRDQGGASRYFTNFPPDDFTPYGSTGLQSARYCLLCGKENDIMDEIKSKESTISCNTIVPTAEKNLHPHEVMLNSAHVNVQVKPQHENEGKNQRHSTLANHAESNGWNTQATIDHSAQQSAWGLERSQLVQLVRSAANLCDSCATAIAQSLVNLKHNPEKTLPRGLDFIAETSADILHLNLVAYVEHLETNGITPTIASLTRLFGFVQHAIQNFTAQASNGQIDELDQIIPFKYISKASRRERNAGCEGLPERDVFKGNHADNPMCQSCGGTKYDRKNGLSICTCEYPEWKVNDRPAQNTHPTVKSTSLMRWLIRLITPPGGVVLDCFAGSGSTLVAAIHEGVHFIGIEQSSEYVQIAEARIAHAQREAGVPVAQEYDCAPDCPIRILGEQSGERKSGGRTHSIGQPKHPGIKSATEWYSTDYHSEPSTGTAARYFQQFPPDSLFAEVEA